MNIFQDTLVRLEQKNYQLCLQHRMMDHERDLNSAAASSRRLLLLLTKSFVETEWGKVSVRALLRSTWQSTAAGGGIRKSPVLILLPDPGLIREIDADLDLHLLLKHSTIIEWKDASSSRPSSFGWSRLLLALPPPRGHPAAPATCTMTSFEIRQQHHHHHHHKLIHQRQLPTLPETIWWLIFQPLFSLSLYVFFIHIKEPLLYYLTAGSC